MYYFLISWNSHILLLLLTEFIKVRMKIGVIKERIFPPDRRVAFSPDCLMKIKELYPTVEIAVEASEIRQYSDQSYKESGIIVTDTIEDCDVLFGVKEVPVEYLIPNKRYFFFSHTIKKQKNNRQLLQEILKKEIELFDYECVVNNEGKRVVGFGRYAGIVGAYNALQLFGLKYELFKLPKASSLKDKNVLFQKLKRQFLPPIKIVVTGKGRVSSGVSEVFKAVKIKEVKTQDFLNKNYSEPVFTVLSSDDYFERIDGSPFVKEDFYETPALFKSCFEKFAFAADVLITGHFQAKEAPVILSNATLKNKRNQLKVVADVSCDIDGSIACSFRRSSIDNPFYGYLPSEEKEVDLFHPSAIGVMSVNNLPTELAKDASDGFGEMLLNTVIPALMDGDKDQLLASAKVTENGRLTAKFSYLQEYVTSS